MGIGSLPCRLIQLVTLVTDGNLDSGAASPDGSILLVIGTPTRTNMGASGLNFPPLQTGEVLTNVNATTQQVAGVLLVNDDSTGTGSYTLAGNAFCRPNAAPIAALTANPTTGPAPLVVNFDASGSSDPDTDAPADTVVSATFNFGDQTPEVTCPGGTGCNGALKVQHTYNDEGNHQATVRVTDSRGKVSENTASVVISVAENTPPIADLEANPTSGAPPLNVTLDATGSEDPDFQDTIASYTFSFGDGTPDVTQGAPILDHTYANRGDLFGEPDRH